MYDLLLKKISETVSLVQEDWETVKAHFTQKKMRRRQFLLQEGDIASRLTFVTKGALYSYSTDPRGVQHVIQFAFEGWWIGDMSSFFTGQPSRLNIEVLEDCELLLLDRPQQEALLAKCSAFETYTRLLFQNAYVALQSRVENTLGLTAEEKYARLTEQHPTLPGRVPQQLIASYLGITPETLSRIRRTAGRG